jgi:protein-disulfide isomerase
MSKADKSHKTNAGGGSNQWVIIGLVGGIVVFAIIAATFLLSGGEPASPGGEADARQAALASDHSPTTGNPGAKVHIVEFLDPACGTCALFYPMVKGWMSEVPDQIRLSVRHIAFHEGADHAVRVLEASRNQGLYWETLEALLRSQNQWVRNHVVMPEQIAPVIAGVGLDMAQLEVDMNSPEVLRRIEKDRADAVSLKVSATPE